MQEPRFTYKSVFWPILLIGVGLILFLGNMQVIPDYDWRKLASLWPLLLVGIGLDLIVGRRNVWASAVVGAATVGGAVLMLIYAPMTGIFQAPQAQTNTFTEPIGSATSAKVKLDLSWEPVRVQALSDASTLFQADITHVGTLNYNASGSGSEKIITLTSSGQSGSWFFNAPTFIMDWKIGLSPKIPLDLEVDVSAGSATLDLTGLQLSALQVDGGAGQTTLTLPAQSSTYNVSYNGSAGSATITLPANTTMSLRVDGSAGATNIRMPANAFIHLEVLDDGAGGLGLPSNLKKISGSSAKKGVWETEGFANAANKISIVIVDISAGAINIR